MNQSGSKDALGTSQDKALLIGVVTTFLSLLPTAYATFVSNSVILFSDFLRCLVEFSAIFLSWCIMRRVSETDQMRFSYGHGKLEEFSALTVGVALLISFVIVLLSAISRFLTPQPVENGVFGFILGGLSVAGNVYFWFKYGALAKSVSSPVISSQSRLFRAKTVASLVVFLSLLLSLYSHDSHLIFYADPIGAIFLAAFLLYSALGLLSASMRDLLDCSLEESLQLRILAALVRFEAGYAGLQSIRTRRGGSKIFIEIFLEFKPETSLQEAYMVISEIKQLLSNSISNGDITIIPLCFRHL